MIDILTVIWFVSEVLSNTYDYPVVFSSFKKKNIFYVLWWFVNWCESDNGTPAFQVFVNDQFLNWDPEHRIKVRIVSARAYHSLFMHNM
jgi:hypothetical protein